MCGDCGASSVHIDVLTATSCTFTKLAQVSNALAYHSRADAASGTFSSPKGVSAWYSGNQPVAVNRSPFRSLHVSSAVSPPAVGVSRTSGLQSRLITPGHGGQSAGQPVTRSLASCRLNTLARTDRHRARGKGRQIPDVVRPRVLQSLLIWQ